MLELCVCVFLVVVYWLLLSLFSVVCYFVKNIILNLTGELNETLPLPPGRLQEVLSVLTSLEAMAAFNQVQVDGLSIEVHTGMHAQT